jgi:hypothetical protein
MAADARRPCFRFPIVTGPARLHSALGGTTLMRVAIKMTVVVGCLLASLLSTWLVWEISIDGRAFHCTDEGTLSLGFWTSAETHQSAGDRIQAGWTWEKLSRVNAFYKLAFLALWIGGSMLACRRIGAGSQAQSHDDYVAQQSS